MRRIALIFLVLAFAAPAGSAARSIRAPVVGLTGDSVAKVDPVTFKPVGRALAIPFPWGAAAISPDRQTLALGANNAGFVRLVDLRRMRTLRDVRIGGSADRIVWLSPRLLVVEVQTASAVRLIALDARTQRVRWRLTVDGSVLQEQRYGSGLVLLVAPQAGIVQAELAVISSTGHLRSALLDSFLAGSSWPDDPAGIGDIRTPGLAVDPAGGHAYVVGAGEPVADVDLASLAVVYHGGNRTLAKAYNGWGRQATWLGNGTIAVAGFDAGASVAADGTETQTLSPAGLTLVDTSTWSTKAIDPSVGDVVRSGAVLLSIGSTYSSSAGPARGSGLSLRGLDGSQRAHLFGKAFVLWTTVVHGLAYAWLNGVSDRRVAVIDPAAGKVLANRTTRLVEIL